MESLASRSLIGGITGGTTAEMYGGNFGNGFQHGAMTAAYGYVFNHTVHETWEVFLSGDIQRSIGTSFSGAANSLADIAQNGPPEAKALMFFAAGTEIVPLTIGAATGASEAFVSLMVAAGTPSNQILLQGIAEFANDYWGNGSPGVTRIIEKAINFEPLTSP